MKLHFTTVVCGPQVVPEAPSSGTWGDSLTFSLACGSVFESLPKFQFSFHSVRESPPPVQTEPNWKYWVKSEGLMCKVSLHCCHLVVLLSHKKNIQRGADHRKRKHSQRAVSQIINWPKGLLDYFILINHSVSFRSRCRCRRHMTSLQTVFTVSY